MSRVITFSRFFPAYHHKAGQPTYFVEKMYNSLHIKYWEKLKYLDLDNLNEINCSDDLIRLFHRHLNADITEVKHHTVRGGNRWKVGDWFSPRIWSCNPYRSKQIIISKDIQIKKIWEIKMEMLDDLENSGILLSINGKGNHMQKYIANNDGLSNSDFFDWFNLKIGKPFIGQIICWNESIEY